MDIHSLASTSSLPFRGLSTNVLMQEAIACIEEGMYEMASKILENVINTDSENAEAWAQLARVADKTEKFDLAITLYKKAILLSPHSSLIYLRLADCYIRLSQIDEAKEVLRYIASDKAVREIPEFYLCVWMIERIEGNFNQAKKRLKQALKIFQQLASKTTSKEHRNQISSQKEILLWDILAHCEVEVILNSLKEEKENLTNFVEYADRVIKSGKNAKGLPSSTPNLLFQLAYYTPNPRFYLEKAAELYRKVFPDLVWISPHCQGNQEKRIVDVNRKIKLGIISTHVDSTHAVGYCFAPLIKFLPRDIFEITLFKIQTKSDKIVSDLKEWLGEITYVSLPNNIQLSREIIASHAVDILWYTDVIMVEHSTMLAYSRLAPVQCMSAGHPVTSGIPTVDYFLSNRLQESSEAQTNYTEKLILMPCFPVIYPEFHLDKNTLTREDIGLPQKGRLYFCCQTPFKINPAMDEIFKKILEEDGEAIILFSYGGTHYSEQLRTRLEKSLGEELILRCSFINVLNQSEFLVALDLVDVILDSFPFAGGNTTLQAICVNQPIVHLSSPELRGKGAAEGTMEMVGIEELIAKTKEEYVEIALKLGKDKSYRKSISQRIAKNKHIIFNQEDTIKKAYTKLFQDLYYQRNLEGYF